MVMAGLDPAIHSNITALRFLPWMAAHVLGLDPGIKGGHDDRLHRHHDSVKNAEFISVLPPFSGAVKKTLDLAPIMAI